MKPPPPLPETEFTFNCPDCDQRVSADKSLAGSSQACPTCGTEFLVPGLGEPENPEESSNLFVWAENTLIKMIIGVPRFILWVIPRETFLFLARAFPLLIKLVRVGFLFLVWLGIVLWPFTLIRNSREAAFARIATADPLQIDFNKTWYLGFCWIWLGLAICGSIWGIFYIVLRKRRRKKKQRQAQASVEQLATGPH